MDNVNPNYQWLFYALLSAVAAALTALFGRIGVEGVNSNFATAIRSVVTTVFLLIACTALGVWKHAKWNLGAKSITMITLTGLAGGASWLFYYHALSLSQGKVFRVSSVDKLSVPLAVVLAFTFLGERPLLVNWLGVGLIVAGVYLVAWK
jgi:transporter family protein